MAARWDTTGADRVTLTPARAPAHAASRLAPAQRPPSRAPPPAIGPRAPYPQNRYAIPIAAMNPATSAASPHMTACRVRRMPTEPKYTAST